MRHTLFCLVLALCLSLPGFASAHRHQACDIPVGARGAAHELEDAADTIHGYLHDTVPDTAPVHAAHELEDVAVTLHDSLHDEAACTVIKQNFRAVHAAWKTFKRTLRTARLTRDDDALKAFFHDVAHAWGEVKTLLGNHRGRHD